MIWALKGMVRPLSRFDSWTEAGREAGRFMTSEAVRYRVVVEEAAFQIQEALSDFDTADIEWYWYPVRP